jgi:hypothetical protein
MKTSHALLSFATLLGLSAAGVISFAGCSSSGETTPTDDTGVVDTGVADTKKETAPVDTAVPLCDDPSAVADGGLTCKDVTTPVGGTACDSQALQDWATACVGSQWPTTAAAGCAAWKAAHPACQTCLQGWSFVQSGLPQGIYPDRDKCFFSVFRSTAFTTANPTLGDCAKIVSCSFDCQEAVCAACDNTTPDDKGNTEMSDCINRAIKKGGTAVPRGACYDIAAGKANSCFGATEGPSINDCIVAEANNPTGTGGALNIPVLQEQLKFFYRGACRDNADWANAADAGVTTSDAGSETGSETGTDAATTETGTETGTDAADASEAG